MHFLFLFLIRGDVAWTIQTGKTTEQCHLLRDDTHKKCCLVVEPFLSIDEKKILVRIVV